LPRSVNSKLSSNKIAPTPPELDVLLELEELLLEDVLTPATARRYLATLVVQVPVHLVLEGGMVVILVSRPLPRDNTSISLPVPWQLEQRDHSVGTVIALPEDEDEDEDEDEELEEELLEFEELLELEEELELEELLLDDELLELDSPVPVQALTAAVTKHADRILTRFLYSPVGAKRVRCARILFTKVKKHIGWECCYIVHTASNGLLYHRACVKGVILFAFIGCGDSSD
jgi:hypothetical protein